MRKYSKYAMSAAGLALTVACHSARADGHDRWNGLYFGGHLSGVTSDVVTTDVTPGGGFFSPASGSDFSFDASSAVGGIQLGYQTQLGVSGVAYSHANWHHGYTLGAGLECAVRIWYCVRRER